MNSWLTTHGRRVAALSSGGMKVGRAKRLLTVCRTFHQVFTHQTKHHPPLPRPAVGYIALAHRAWLGATSLWESQLPWSKRRVIITYPPTMLSSEVPSPFRQLSGSEKRAGGGEGSRIGGSTSAILAKFSHFTEKVELRGGVAFFRGYVPDTL